VLSTGEKLSTRLISENQGIAVESLSVTGLARTKPAKSVHDAGWTAFVNMLEYKAQRYGRALVKIGRFEPTSQTCSLCGTVDGPKPLHIREWTCTACGTLHDRDHNAALNIHQAAGLAVTACGAPVRPESVWHSAKKQEATDSPPETAPRSGTATGGEGQNPRLSRRGACQLSAVPPEL